MAAAAIHQALRAELGGSTEPSLPRNPLSDRGAARRAEKGSQGPTGLGTALGMTVSWNPNEVSNDTHVNE